MSEAIIKNSNNGLKT